MSKFNPREFQIKLDEALADFRLMTYDRPKLTPRGKLIFYIFRTVKLPKQTFWKQIIVKDSKFKKYKHINKLAVLIYKEFNKDEKVIIKCKEQRKYL